MPRSRNAVQMMTEGSLIGSLAPLILFWIGRRLTRHGWDVFLSIDLYLALAIFMGFRLGVRWWKAVRTIRRRERQQTAFDANNAIALGKVQAPATTITLSRRRDHVPRYSRVSTVADPVVSRGAGVLLPLVSVLLHLSAMGDQLRAAVRHRLSRMRPS